VSYFDAAFGMIVGVEGGYVNDPQDPGGETKYGISKRRYPNEDIANLTLERAKFLYQRDYWAANGCDKLPWTEAFLVFDSAVNGGNPQRWLQMYSGLPPLEFAVGFQAEHIQYLASLQNWAHNARGWSRRLLKIFHLSLKEP
jgi:lysozyme family protein